MKAVLHAEWTKLRTLPGTAWLALGIVLMTIGLSVAAAAAVTCPAGCQTDPVKVSLTGVQLGQALVAVLAVSMIGAEYGTGMIHTSLAAVPRRLSLLLAKAMLLGGVSLALGVVTMAGSLLAGSLILPGHGFTTAHGFPALSATEPAVLRATAGSALYLMLIALLSLGVATIVRDSGAAIGLVLGLLYIFPIIASVVRDPSWHTHLEEFGPMTAGLSVQAVIAVKQQAVAPWTGLGILAAWAVGALLAGGAVLRLRDA